MGFWFNYYCMNTLKLVLIYGQFSCIEKIIIFIMAKNFKIVRHFGLIFFELGTFK